MRRLTLSSTRAKTVAWWSSVRSAGPGWSAVGLRSIRAFRRSESEWEAKGRSPTWANTLLTGADRKAVGVLPLVERFSMGKLRATGKNSRPVWPRSACLAPNLERCWLGRNEPGLLPEVCFYCSGRGSRFSNCPPAKQAAGFQASLRQRHTRLYIIDCRAFQGVADFWNTGPGEAQHDING